MLKGSTINKTHFPKPFTAYVRWYIKRKLHFPRTCGIYRALLTLPLIPSNRSLNKRRYRPTHFIINFASVHMLGKLSRIRLASGGIISEGFCGEKEQLSLQSFKQEKGHTFGKRLQNDLHITSGLGRKWEAFSFEEKENFTFCFALTCKYGFCTSAPSDQTEEFTPPSSVPSGSSQPITKARSWHSLAHAPCSASPPGPLPPHAFGGQILAAGREKERGRKGIKWSGKEYRHERYFKE